MSRKTLKSAKSSKVKIDKKKLDIYDQLRPHSGIKYYLSQTEINWSAGVQSVHLKQTAVEYEPGQDLTTPPVEQESLARYTKRKYRGPVWRFQEEIEEEKREARAERMKRIVRKRLRAAASKTATSQKDKLHDHIVHSIGPEWYHELSNKQMHSADKLKDALVKDHKNKTVDNTQDILTELGLAVWPHHTKIAYALKKYYQCPVEFLLKLYKLNRSKDEIAGNCYTLDNRLLLSAVVHLTMRNTLRELHLRIPSPPKVQKGKHKEEVKKKLPHHPSPYLNPFPFIPQADPESISKSRRKEYPKSRYFNYVKDMYEMYYEDQSESSIRKQGKKAHQSKYDKPPKIPVRQLARKLIGEKKYRLKKPSAYVSPCDEVEDKSKKSRIEISKEEQTSIKQVPKDEEIIDPIQTKPSAQGNEEKLQDEAIQNDKEEEITDDCTCKPAGENRIEKETIEDRYYLCTCGQADKEERERNYQKQRYQRNKQFLYDLNMFNIEHNTFYYPCTCHREETECCTLKLNKMADKVDEINKLIEETEDKWNKNENDDTEQNSTIANIDKDDAKQNKEESDGMKQQEASDGMKNKKRPEGSRNKDNADKKFKFGEQTGENETKDNKDQKKIIEENVVERGSRQIRKSLAYIKVNSVNQGEATEAKDNDDGEESKEDAEEDVTKRKAEEKCRCMKMYEKYMNKHEHCLDLFEDYKMKLEQDMCEYMKDIEENRCTCGDSGEVNNANDTGKDDDTEETVEGCTCGNVNREHGRNSVEEIVKGCTCAKARRKRSRKDVNSEEIEEGCTCGNKHGEFSKDEREMNDARTSSHSQNALKKSLGKLQTKDEDSQEEEQETNVDVVKEVDARIFVLDKFPKKKKKQMALLKKALAALAQDGYPLAQLPECHRLPHFQVWLDKRSGKYLSMAERAKLLEESRMLWNHIDICKRHVSLPELGIHPSLARKMTWAGAYKYKRMITDTMYKFTRFLKQAYVSETQEFFPTTFHHKMPNKTFRDCYFAYLPSDEHQINVNRPWQLHEHKDATKGERCN
ncbi:uncharacterized protein CBL_09841 [Carabus blaptoides fortunei]